jgi:hypothetical protein
VQQVYNDARSIPGWTEITILWDDIHLQEKPIRDIIAWVESTSGGRYYLYGYKAVEGFTWGFEDPSDAVHFRLIWA